MLIEVVMSKFIDLPLAIMFLFLEVLLFPFNLENKKLSLSFQLKLNTILPLQLLRNVSYVSSLWI
jgi:hypothetical protein